MKRFFILCLTMMLVGGLIGYGIITDTGYVLIYFNSMAIEMSFWMAVLVNVTAFVGIYFSLRLLVALYGSGNKVNQWLGSNHDQRARQKTLQGLIELAEGNWQIALRHLKQSAGKSNTPLINYLAAARAAQELGDFEGSDELLRKAHDSTSGSEVAVGITQAQLQLARGQYEQCLATLLRLKKASPRHSYVLKLLRQVYIELKDWKKVSEIIPVLQKRSIGDDKELLELKRKTYVSMMADIVPVSLLSATNHGQDIVDKSNYIKELIACWKGIPKELKKDSVIVQSYVGYLVKLQAEDEAEKVIRSALQHQWTDQLVRHYGMIKSNDIKQQLLLAEGFLQERPNNPVLLLSLGRLCLRNQLWGKAREYLQLSLKLKPHGETYAELGNLLARLGDQKQSAIYFREGLMNASTVMTGVMMPASGSYDKDK